MTAAPVGSRENPVLREAGRVLLVDGADRVLLVRGSDPGRPGSRYWFTVGGGLDPGEDVAEAAARELREETGLAVAPTDLGQVVWRETTEFPYDGTWHRQRQVFYLLRVDSWEVAADALDPAEEHYIHEHRWWSLGELELTTEKIYPPDLSTLLRSVGVR